MSKIIGLPSHFHDAAICLIIDGQIVFAEEEEKLTGIKSIYNPEIWPTKALEVIKKNFDVDLQTCDHIAQARIYTLDQRMKKFPILPTKLEMGWEYNLQKKLKSFSHHRCHAMGSYFTSGMEGKVIAFSHDGSGVRSSGKIYLCEDGHTDLIHSQWVGDCASIAGMWARCTTSYGWVALKDEGKVVGLAGHGNPHIMVYELLSKCLYYDNNLSIKGTGWDGKLAFVLDYLRRNNWFTDPQKRADFAATLQKYSQDLLYKLFTDLHNLYPDYRKLSLSGGLFANVKINQFINNLNYFDEVFIHPAMGDAGLALGAAISQAVELKEIKKPLKFDHVYLGESFTEKEWTINVANNASRLKVEKFNIKKIASLINSGYIIGLFIDKTEYGPRALGNRSIIVKPTDTKTHQKLNQRLDRTETMPFAPSVLAEYADEVFECSKSKYTGEFMTMCYNTRDEWVDRIPAVVHPIDKSARPHILKRETNPLYYDIVDEYRKVSGFPVVLNTSLNAHGDPINNYPSQALKLLLDNRLDYLVTETNIYSQQ